MNKLCFVTTASFMFFSLTISAQNTVDISPWNKNGNVPMLFNDLSYEVHGNYNNPVKSENLKTAKRLSDFIPGYPVNWIDAFVSVEILATCSGIVRKAISNNDVLSEEQKIILKTADGGTGITINTIYKKKKENSGGYDNKDIHIILMLVPEIEAAYIGGLHQMKKYLKENVIDKISLIKNPQLQNTTVNVLFMVNEDGIISDMKILVTSGNINTDNIILNAVNKMPKWIPAQNANGIKVRQEFVLTVGNSGC
jgi:hypothetical protein